MGGSGRGCDSRGDKTFLHPFYSEVCVYCALSQIANPAWANFVDRYCSTVMISVSALFCTGLCEIS